MPKRLIQRHDAFFQRLLDQPESAATLLRERLPEEVACLLVDEPPEPIPGSFISQRLRGYRTDRLIRTRTLTHQTDSRGYAADGSRVVPAISGENQPKSTTPLFSPTAP
ncbi:hypothetical protein CCP4SC76_5780004 [Gammaproteobacteria bacterium]